MSFLAPLFLLGTLAIALPVIFHLMRRVTRERTRFSSLMFLEPTPPRVSRKSRIDELLLLLLRCVVIAFLALAFARPFFTKPSSAKPHGGNGTKTVLLVDTSASMRRGDLWAQARKKAEAWINRAQPEDQLALLAFDQQLARVITFEGWKAMAVSERTSRASRALSDLAPGWGGTRLGYALITAMEMLEDKAQTTPSTRKQIIVISDLQAGSRLDGLQGLDWPRPVYVLLDPVQSRSTLNAGASTLTERDLAVKASPRQQFRVRITNARASKKEQFILDWAQGGTRSEVYVPPGQSRVVTGPAATNFAPQNVRLLGDDETFDNQAFYMPPEPETVKVAYWGRESDKDAAQPLFFLKRALQPTSRLQFQVTNTTPETLTTPGALKGTSLLIFTEPVPEERLGAIREWVHSGGTMLTLLKEPAMASSLAHCLQLDALAVEENSGRDALLAQIDFRHPIFAPFADPRFNDFSKIRFWRHRRLGMDAFKSAHVLAAFDNGNPFMVEAPSGKGRVLLLTSGWHPADSQLALSSKFVPLLFGILEYSGAIQPRPNNYIVGDRVSLPPQLLSENSLLVRRPDGAQLPVDATGQFAETTLPGFYQATAGALSFRFAVNLEAGETEVTPLTPEELSQLGVPVTRNSFVQESQTTAAIKRAQAHELEGRQKLWRWLIIIALLVLLAETWWAGRKTSPATVAPAA